MQFDRVAILDWSAAGTPKTGKDSIWLGITDENGTLAENIPTRLEAESTLSQLIEDSLAKGTRLLLGVDFALSAPKGFTERLTGAAHPFALWSFLRERIIEGPDNYTNYREVAAQMNASFDEEGPFWGNTARQDIQGLPRKKPPLPKGIETYRHTEVIARHEGAMPKTLWQLAGAGAVGAQSLTGIAMLARLKAIHPKIKAWPFEPLDQITLAEVYPSLIADEVRAATTKTCVPDKVQVTLLSKALYSIACTNQLGTLLKDAPPDGAILGAGKGAVLQAAVPQTAPVAPMSKHREILLRDLPSAIADLNLPLPRIMKTSATDLIGRVLARDIELGALTLKARSRIQPNMLPAILHNGVSETQTFAPLRACAIGPNLKGKDQLLRHMLIEQGTNLSPSANFPHTASRIKARITAVAIDHDLVVCIEPMTGPKLSDVLGEEPTHDIHFEGSILSPLKIAMWRDTPVLILTQEDASDLAFLGLVLGPVARLISGERYEAPSVRRALANAEQSGLVYGTLGSDTFRPLPKQPPEIALIQATHIAEIDEGSQSALTYAFRDLGLA